MNAAREELRSLVDEKCLTVGHSYTLTTGRRSGFYFDCKKAMLDGRCLGLIADAFLEEAGKLPRFPKAIGGLTMGADFIVGAVIQRAFETGKPMVSGSIVRKEQKQHGAGNRIENELPAGTSIMVVDDVVTTGSSTETACDAFIAAGYDVVGIVALVDRESGGCEALARDAPGKPGREAARAEVEVCLSRQERRSWRKGRRVRVLPFTGEVCTERAPV